MQAPAWQMSLVQLTLSAVHAAPSGLFATVHPPFPSHMDDAWQSAAVHEYAAPPQTPAVQTSFFVHAVPSLHAVPFAATGLEHLPLVASHVPAAWH